MKRYPAIYSTNFPNGFNQSDTKTFVELTDYRHLEKQYIKLFKRYQREKNRNTKGN